MRAYPLFILALASGIFAAAVIGARDTGPECLTCHTGTAPKGNYRLELPMLDIQAPSLLIPVMASVPILKASFFRRRRTERL